MLDVDLEKGILILERLHPGNTLATLDNDVEKTYIAANIAKNYGLMYLKVLISQKFLREKSSFGKFIISTLMVSVHFQRKIFITQ